MIVVGPAAPPVPLVAPPLPVPAPPEPGVPVAPPLPVSPPSPGGDLAQAAAESTAARSRVGAVGRGNFDIGPPGQMRGVFGILGGRGRVSERSTRRRRGRTRLTPEAAILGRLAAFLDGPRHATDTAPAQRPAGFLDSVRRAV